jgi:hypothetical protein
LRLPQNGLVRSRQRYSVAGKVRQGCTDIRVLFIRAAIVNDVFQDYMENVVTALNARRREVGAVSAKSEEEEQSCDVVLVRGPVKSPERTLQKCVRVYRRDVACLTDLVRCTIVAQTIQQVYELFSAIRSMSVVHSHLGEGTERGGGEGAAEEHRMRDIESGGGVTDETRLLKDEESFFRITACKNRFREGSKHFNSETCFRNISLSLEVGFVFEEGDCVLVPDVAAWQAQGADTLICELQIHLASMLYMQENPTDTASAHADYVAYRNLAAR